MDLAGVEGPWSVGADEDNDGVCSVYRINSGLHGSESRAKYPGCILLRLAYEETDNRGIPTSPASKALKDIDERVGVLLRSDGGTILAGYYTTPDLGRTLCLYAKEIEPLIASFPSVLSTYGGDWQVLWSGDDPYWNVYTELLTHALAGEPDFHLVRKLDMEGVDIRIERAVDHYLYFPTYSSAQVAISEAFADISAEGPTKSGRGDWCVNARLRHTLQFADLAHYRRVLTKDVGAPLGGSYDGWGVPLEETNEGPNARISRRSESEQR